MQGRPIIAGSLAELSDDEFRARIRDWLIENLTGRFAGLRGAGGPGREHEAFEERLAWDQHLAAAGWTALSWPVTYGGRGAAVGQQMIFHEEYVRAAAPARVSHMGEQLLGPTLIAFGTPEQQRRFLPAIVSVTELWCQGFSEPGAGSDLASVATAGRLAGDHWQISGQKVWTSLAHVADWCFVLARTERGSRRSAGLSMLLVPMRQPGVTVRPIRQMTGTSEFNEVFFDDARTDAAYALGTFISEGQPAAGTGASASVMKLLWSRWLRALGELAVDVQGPRALLAGGQAYELDAWQRLHLFSRADTIYGGSDEIQLGIVASRALGLPREPASGQDGA